MNNKTNQCITLNDFKSQDIFLLLNKEYKDNIFKKSLLKAGSQSKLAILIKKNLDYPDIKQSTVSFLVKKATLRLDLIHFLCNLIDTEFDEKQILGIKGVQTSRMIFNPNLNLTLSSELAQILANLYCDGTIVESNCYTATYYNSYMELISRFKNNVVKVFGRVDLYEWKTNVNAINLPAFVGKLLYRKFKLYNDNVPTQIINSSKEIKSAYLQAVFDDEGSIHKGHGQIRIKMKPNSYIEDIQKLIQEFGIETSKVIKEHDKRNGRDYYFFLISGMYNVRKFHDEIDFFHPKKKNLMIKHLNNIKTPNYGYKAKNLVYNALKENGPLTAKQIALKLNRDKRIIHQHLVNLKKQNFVDYTKIKRKFVYEYLWKAN